jgi:hypothetical protein
MMKVYLKFFEILTSANRPTADNDVGHAFLAVSRACLYTQVAITVHHQQHVYAK